MNLNLKWQVQCPYKKNMVLMLLINLKTMIKNCKFKILTETYMKHKYKKLYILLWNV